MGHVGQISFFPTKAEKGWERTILSTQTTGSGGWRTQGGKNSHVRFGHQTQRKIQQKGEKKALHPGGGKREEGRNKISSTDGFRVQGARSVRMTKGKGGTKTRAA